MWLIISLLLVGVAQSQDYAPNYGAGRAGRAGRVGRVGRVGRARVQPPNSLSYPSYPSYPSPTPPVATEAKCEWKFNEISGQDNDYSSTCSKQIIQDSDLLKYVPNDLCKDKPCAPPVEPPCEWHIPPCPQCPAHGDCDSPDLVVFKPLKCKYAGSFPILWCPLAKCEELSSKPQFGGIVTDNMQQLALKCTCAKPETTFRWKSLNFEECPTNCEMPASRVTRMVWCQGTTVFTDGRPDSVFTARDGRCPGSKPKNSKVCPAVATSCCEIGLPEYTTFAWKRNCPDCESAMPDGTYGLRGCMRGADNPTDGFLYCTLRGQQASECKDNYVIVDDVYCRNLQEPNMCVCAGADCTSYTCVQDPIDVGVGELGATSGIKSSLQIGADYNTHPRVSGWDMKEMNYFWQGNDLHVSIECYGTCGDADNVNHSHDDDDEELTELKKQGGRDTEDLGGSEAMSVMFTVNNINTMIVGVPSIFQSNTEDSDTPKSQYISANKKFSAWKVPGARNMSPRWVPRETDFGQRIQVDVGDIPQWGAPTNGLFTFTLTDFLTELGAAPGDKISALAFAGSFNDGSIGEDKMVCDIPTCRQIRVCPVCDQQCGLLSKMTSPGTAWVCDGQPQEQDLNAPCQCAATECCGTWMSWCPTCDVCDDVGADLTPEVFCTFRDGYDYEVQRKEFCGLPGSREPDAGKCPAQTSKESCECVEPECGNPAKLPVFPLCSSGSGVDAVFRNMYGISCPEPALDGRINCDKGVRQREQEWTTVACPLKKLDAHCGIPADQYEICPFACNGGDGKCLTDPYPNGPTLKPCGLGDKCPLIDSSQYYRRQYHAIKLSATKPLWWRREAQNLGLQKYIKDRETFPELTAAIWAKEGVDIPDFISNVATLRNAPFISQSQLDNLNSPPTFTNNQRFNTLGDSRVQDGKCVLYGDIRGDVGVPEVYSDKRSGFDMKTVLICLDDTRLTALITCEGTCGDADNEAGEGAEGPGLKQYLGRDFPAFANSESVLMAIDMDDDLKYDYIMGIPSDDNKCEVGKFVEGAGPISSLYFGPRPQNAPNSALSTVQPYDLGSDQLENPKPALDGLRCFVPGMQADGSAKQAAFFKATPLKDSVLLSVDLATLSPEPLSDMSTGLRLHFSMGSYQDGGIGEDHVTIIFRQPKCRWVHEPPTCDDECDHEEKLKCKARTCVLVDNDQLMPESCCVETATNYDPPKVFKKCPPKPCSCRWRVSEWTPCGCPDCNEDPGMSTRSVDCECQERGAGPFVAQYDKSKCVTATESEPISSTQCYAHTCDYSFEQLNPVCPDIRCSNEYSIESTMLCKEVSNLKEPRTSYVDNQKCLDAGKRMAISSILACNGHRDNPMAEPCCYQTGEVCDWGSEVGYGRQGGYQTGEVGY